MTASMIEPLDARLLFHNMGPLKNPEPALIALPGSYNYNQGSSAASANLGGTVNFDDLVILARNYNQTNGLGTLPPASFASDWSLAESLVGHGGSLNSKGKLTVTMGSFNNASITLTSKGRTQVFFNRVSRNGEVWTADVYSRTFKGVRSIEIFGSAGDDEIRLGEGLRFATVHAGDGDDTIRGGGGESVLHGGDGDERIYGGGGNDTLFGEEGDDRLYGDTGDDQLEGGVGKDRLDGGKGRNRLAGGSGTDQLTVRAGKDKTDRDNKDRLTELS